MSVRPFCRNAVALLLAALLANLPALAAPNHSVGFVLVAQSTQLDGLAAASGTNLFPGDSLVTDSGGSVRLQFAANQIYLLPSSGVTLASNGAGVMATLASGTAGFSSSGASPIAIRALDVTIRPQTPAATHARVTVLSENELEVASFTGTLQLELDGETYLLAAGKTYGVEITDNAPRQADKQIKSARSKRRLIVFLFGATAVAAGIVYLVRELNESPDTP
ncbi:MAG TPA: hypothetical protein VGR81_09125 [Candidatus Acidoferrales bacterium]|nr:hypothetical protein [Candidatus Acidoferrales bacterium]